MIDILLATYNGERYLEEQIDSIRQQTFTDWRLLISDDGSSDGTLRIIERYEALDTRIICVNKTVRFGGACPNFMFLLRNSSDSYFMFCDQDDVWLPSKIEDSLQIMRLIENTYSEAVPALVFTDMRVVDADLSTISPSFERFASINPDETSLVSILSNPVAAGCTILANASLRELTFLTPDNQPMDMHDWWITLVAASFGHIGHVNHPTSLYRQHGTNEFGAIRKSNIRSLLSLGGAPMGILKILAQTESFYEVYGQMLEPGDKSRVAAIASVRTAPRIARLPLMIRGGSWKRGRLRRIGEAIIVVLMKMSDYPLNHS